MTYLWLLLIPYTTAAFGIHGGEGITGVNRQVRNLICAIPFALVAGFVAARLGCPYAWVAALLFFVLSYGGTSLGFRSAALPGARPTSLWLSLKGFVTFPPLGAVLLPVSYAIGYGTKYTNVLAEYLSGTLYGAALAAIAIGFAQ